MNIFNEDSTLRIDADKSAYSIDDIRVVSVDAYQLSRDESGKLVISNKARTSVGDEKLFLLKKMGFDSQNMLIKWEKTGDKTGIISYL